ncbi:MAG TPA: hypothetical protein VFG68_08570 [Fimbriiglobus sp.]|nr:hypothetical protein [Fimbriiglobus sp.]
MGRLPPTPRRLANCAALAAVLMAGCEALRTGAPRPSASGERAPASGPAPKKPGGVYPPLRVSRFVFYADVPLEPNDAVFKELEDLPDQVQRELRLPVSNSVIQVFLFDDQERYEAFMKDRFPWLPVRRAYFIADQKRPGSADDLSVYTWMGPHLRTDLRHELTHALLHGVLKGVPLWLDEGLAGFFEQPPSHDGVNPEHLDALRKGPFQPDLGRLEKIGQVSQMEKPEYRESWAWVHFLLRGDPHGKAALLDYMQQLRENPTPGQLLPRLREAVPDPPAALADHLARTTLPTPTARGRVK